MLGVLLGTIICIGSLIPCDTMRMSAFNCISSLHYQQSHISHVASNLDLVLCFIPYACATAPANLTVLINHCLASRPHPPVSGLELFSHMQSELEALKHVRNHSIKTKYDHNAGPRLTPRCRFHRPQARTSTAQETFLKHLLRNRVCLRPVRSDFAV
jgi:hypothetical protein